MVEPRTAEAIVDAAIAALPERHTLVYVAYDDQLAYEQITDILEGNVDKAMESIDEWEMECREYYIPEIIAQVIPDEDDREIVEDDHDEMERLRDAICDRDDSDVVTGLLRGTHSQLWRYRVDAFEWEYDDSTEEVCAKVIKALGVDYDDNIESVREMVVNADPECALSVIWYGDATPVIQPILDRHWSSKWERAHIHWESPHVVLLNSFSGSGCDGEVVGPVVLPYVPTNLRLDSHHDGYGWDEVAGVHKPAYACDVDLFEIKEGQA
jgi:hypothetical protein